MARRRNAVRLGIPALVVTALAIFALWRVGTPPPDGSPAAGTGLPGRGRLAPIVTIADVQARSAVGRRAALERVEVREVTSPRTFWFVMADSTPAFAVLDPDVRRVGGVGVTPGAAIALVGLVRPSPPADQAMRQWQIDRLTASRLEAGGTYLHVTEVRPAL